MLISSMRLLTFVAFGSTMLLLDGPLQSLVVNSFIITSSDTKPHHVIPTSECLSSPWQIQRLLSGNRLHVSRRNGMEYNNGYDEEDTDDEFAKFAASLETSRSSKTTMVASSSDVTTTTMTATTTESKAAPPRKPKAYPKSDTTNVKNYKWQVELEKLLLDPTLSVSQRQTLISNLFNANEEIRNSVVTALRDRNIDALLTPTQRKIQDGTRAVARQVTNDILPSIAETVRNSDSVGSVIADTIRRPLSSPDEVTRIGNRLFNAFNTQFRQNLQTLTGDVMNPSRIPQRISQQTEDILKEIQNVFSETPIGLQEPKYTVIYTTDNYEVRDYEGYYVATTNIGTNDDKKSMWSVTGQGAAFNTLAAYIFGANQQKLVMEMTTPVTTTMSGEMRFYVNIDVPPEPLKQDESLNIYTANHQKICIQYIPPAVLAVRRFTGFVTDGEILRQKDALLTALKLDQHLIELDVPHGSTVGHVIFQYNPPYTLPIVRRNEIAVPVVLLQQFEEDQFTMEDNTRTTSGSQQTITSPAIEVVVDNKVNGA